MLEERSYCVYIHTNKINGKKYVGQTCRPNPEYRWNKNGKGYYRQTYFYNDIQEYGWDNFETEIIKSGLTHEEANKLESKLIVEYNTLNRDKGYNLQAGGSGHQNHQESDNIQNDKSIKIYNNILLKDKYLLNIAETCEYTGLEQPTIEKILKNQNNFALLIDGDYYVIRPKLEEYFERCAQYKINI